MFKREKGMASASPIVPTIILPYILSVVIPLNGRPTKTKLKEVDRPPKSSDGWETVIYEGDDGRRYVLTTNGSLENWTVAPPDPSEEVE